LATVKKAAQRGLVAVVIMLALILASYSLADAQAQIVPIPCGNDIDATINNTNLYPSSTPQRFVLGAGCIFTASATVQPKNLDEVVCAVAPDFSPRGPAFDPTAHCTIKGSSTLAQVLKPQGTVYLEGLNIEGGDFKGSSGTGVGIAEGSMSDQSMSYGIVVRNNEGAGITNGRGVHRQIELTSNTTNPNALGFIGSGIKCVHECNVERSYVHETQGNGIWCDSGCDDASNALFSAFHVNANLVVNNKRGGIRYENVGSASSSSPGEAIIENNEVHGNTADATSRGGIDIRDAENATVRGNRFGAVTITSTTPPLSVNYQRNISNIGIRASNSGKSGRGRLANILVTNNTMNGEAIKSCGGAVLCQ
jgi:hypothetical protein